MKKILALLLALTMSMALVACGGNNTNGGNNDAGNNNGDANNNKDVTIKVAAIETAYGSQVWQDVCDAFTAETGIKVDLTTDKNLEDVISGPMQNGEYPDVVHLATGRSAALTEQLIKQNALHDLTNVLGMNVPGESVKVSDKIAGGFTETSITNPYGDGKTYLAPMFYSPCGLFYNAKLFDEKGWTVPTTWDEMWELGDKAKAEGIALFTYPTTGYFDTFFPTLIYSIGGAEFWESVRTYEEGIWDSKEGKQLISVIEKLITYVHPNTPAQANNQDFTKNQLMVMTNDALFMPNGTWITGEMANAVETLENEFAWGMTALPGFDANVAPYAYCWFEQAWIPAGAEHITEAEKFVAFLYSDKACELFANATNAEGQPTPAIQPVIGIADKLEGENKMFYSIYDNGAKAAMGAFAPFAEIPGIDVASVYFAPIDSLVAGTLTIDEYIENIKTASAQMRANLLG